MVTSQSDLGVNVEIVRLALLCPYPSDDELRASLRYEDASLPLTFLFSLGCFKLPQSMPIQHVIKDLS